MIDWLIDSAVLVVCYLHVSFF